jgi:hypothetical protein
MLTLQSRFFPDRTYGRVWRSFSRVACCASNHQTPQTIRTTWYETGVSSHKNNQRNSTTRSERGAQTPDPQTIRTTWYERGVQPYEQSEKSYHTVWERCPNTRPPDNSYHMVWKRGVQPYEQSEKSYHTVWERCPNTRPTRHPFNWAWERCSATTTSRHLVPHVLRVVCRQQPHIQNPTNRTSRAFPTTWC